MKMPIGKCLSVLLLFLVAAPLSGQTTGAVLGRVTDPSGAVVPSARVEIVSEQTALSTSTTAGPRGDYTLPNVEPGLYRVNVSAAGFKTRVVRNVSVSVNQTVRLDVALEVGDVATEVEVRATAPVVESDRSSVGSVVDGRQIAAMPLNGRTDIFTLLALAPGVQRSPFSANPLISGGTHFGSINMTVDGVTNNDVGNERLLGPIPSLDAIAEFKVIASGASAEFGRGGAQVVVATKSGTNDLHGSVFAFNRNRALSAKDFFATQLPKPPFNRNEFGATLGGPILRNKLFFFAAYEGLRRRVTTTSVVAMPTAALKAGDFSGLPPIRDPLTGAPFPGNRIPADRISPVARELLQFASDPNTPTAAPAGLGNNFTVNVPTRENMDRFSLRIDHQATAADHISGRFFAVENGPFVSFLGGGTDKFGNWGGFGVATRNAMGEYTRILSSSMINEFRVGFSQERNFRTPQNPDFDPSLLMPGLIPPVAGLGGLPTVTITGFRGFSDPPGSGDIKRSYEISERFTWTRSRHAVKAGVEWQRASAFNFQNPPPFRGGFTFDGRFTGHPFADFLLGALAATGRVSRNVEAEPVNDRYAAYVQDDWVATPRLTLNLGLRYEYASPFKNARHDLANFYPELGQVVVLDGQGDPRLMAVLPIVEGARVGLGPDNYMNKDRNNFAPRVGFAFRPLGTTRLVARGSYGIFYNVIPAYVGPINLSLNPPFRVTESFEPAPGPVPSLSFANPFSRPGHHSDEPWAERDRAGSQEPLPSAVEPHPRVRGAAEHGGARVLRGEPRRPPRTAIQPERSAARARSGAAAPAVPAVRSDHVFRIRAGLDHAPVAARRDPPVRLWPGIPVRISVDQGAGRAGVRAPADGQSEPAPGPRQPGFHPPALGRAQLHLRAALRQGETLREVAFRRGGQDRGRLADRGPGELRQRPAFLGDLHEPDAGMAERPGGHRGRPASSGPQHRPLVQSGGLRRAGAVHLRQLGAKHAVRPGVLQLGCGALQAHAHQRQVYPGVPRGVLQHPEPSELRTAGGRHRDAGDRRPHHVDRERGPEHSVRHTPQLLRQGGTRQRPVIWSPTSGARARRSQGPRAAPFPISGWVRGLRGRGAVSPRYGTAARSVAGAAGLGALVRRPMEER